MKILLVGLVAVCLSACGSSGAVKSCINGKECTSFAVVTEARASGLVAVATGDVDTCKVSTFGDVSTWKVTYKGKNCEAVLNEIP